MSPVHVTAEVLASKRIGAFQHVTLVAPGVGERFRPGAFVAVSVGTGGYHLARRAFWIHRVRPLGGYAATVTLVVEPRGEGTRWLATRQRGDRVEVTGPLGGRPFALPKEPVPVLLVGEGYAAAPLFALAERLRERDCPVNLVLGAPDEAHLLSALEARRTARAVTIASPLGAAVTVACEMISEPSPPALIVSTLISAAWIFSGEMTRLLGKASLAASSPPSAAGAGAGSAVQRATPKPVTAASAMAPATVPRRRLSLVIIFYLRC